MYPGPDEHRDDDCREACGPEPGNRDGASARPPEPHGRRPGATGAHTPDRAASRRDLVIFCRLFLFAIGAVLPIDALLGAAGMRPPAGRVSAAPAEVTWASIRAGEAGPALEEALVERSFFARGSAALYRELGFAVAGRLPDDLVAVFPDDLTAVAPGRAAAPGRRPPPWLFLRTAVRDASETHVRQVAGESARRIAEVARALGARGSRVLVSLMPSRVRLCEDLLGNPWGARGEFLPAIAAELERRGAATLSLEAALREAAREAPVYYRDDHHWTGHGARAAARAAADAVRARWPEIIEERVRGAAAPPIAVTWETESEGSLRGKLGFRRDSSCDRAFRDPQPRPRFRRSGPEAPAPPVAVLTSSHGLWGSPEFLEIELGVPVQGVVSVGHGSLHAPALLLARRLARRDLPAPEVIVWEIPEDHLWAPPGEPHPWAGVRLPAPVREPRDGFAPLDLRAAWGLTPVAEAGRAATPPAARGAGGLGSGELDPAGRAPSPEGLARWRATVRQPEFLIAIPEGGATGYRSVLELTIRCPRQPTRGLVVLAGRPDLGRVLVDDGAPARYRFRLSPEGGTIAVRVGPLRIGTIVAASARWTAPQAR